MATALTLVVPASQAHAGVGKLSSPEVDAGKFDVQYNLRRTGDDRKSKNNAQQHKVEFEYGLTEDWMIGIELEAERKSPSQNNFTAYGGELKYQMTDQGAWWLSSAVKAEYAIAAQASGTDAAETGLLLMRTDGKFRTMANIKLEREIGDGRAKGTQISTAFQGIYRVTPYFAPGLEWHADYGKIREINGTDDQEHYIGPVIIGKLFEHETTALSYEVGYYRGLTDASADDAQRFRIKYEIHF